LSLQWGGDSETSEIEDGEEDIKMNLSRHFPEPQLYIPLLAKLPLDKAGIALLHSEYDFLTFYHPKARVWEIRSHISSKEGISVFCHKTKCCLH
jgi:hypothetical protein